MQLPEQSVDCSGHGDASQMQKCSCGRGSAKDKSREFCHVYCSRYKCSQNMQGVVICASASTVVTHMVTTRSLLNLEWKEKEKGIITHLDNLLNFYM